MNEHDLRWQLRQLPREIEPAHDLWPQIEARLSAPAKARPGWMAYRGWALAASLCLAVGLGWRLVPAPGELPGGDALLQNEVALLDHEYNQAMASLRSEALPAELAPALATLDRSAEDIRAALKRSPASTYLLEQLRRTYARRLSITQRALVG